MQFLQKASYCFIHAAITSTGADLTLLSGIVLLKCWKPVISFHSWTLLIKKWTRFEEDAYAIRALDNQAWTLLSVIFLKFSLYGERVGGRGFVCDDQETAQKVWSARKATVRRIYSSPCNRCIDRVLMFWYDETLAANWKAELQEMWTYYSNAWIA